jgi:hypothetical protein
VSNNVFPDEAGRGRMSPRINFTNASKKNVFTAVVNYKIIQVIQSKES